MVLGHFDCLGHVECNETSFSVFGVSENGARCLTFVRHDGKKKHRAKVKKERNKKRQKKHLTNVKYMYYVNVPILNIFSMKNTLIAGGLTDSAKRLSAATVLAAAVASMAACGGGSDADAAPQDPNTPAPAPSPAPAPTPAPLPPPEIESVLTFGNVGKSPLVIENAEASIGVKAGSLYVLKTTKNHVAECVLANNTLTLTPTQEALTQGVESPEVCTTRGFSAEGANVTTEIVYEVDTKAPRIKMDTLTINGGYYGDNGVVNDVTKKFEPTDANKVTVSLPHLPAGYTYDAATDTLHWNALASVPNVTVVFTDALGNVKNGTIQINREVYTPAPAPSPAPAPAPSCPPGQIFIP